MKANKISHKKKKLVSLVRIIISIVLIWWLIAFADIRQITDSLIGFSPLWLIGVLALVALSVLISAWKWGVLLHALGLQIAYGKLFNIYSTGLFFNNFLPSSIGGDGVRIFLAGKYTGNTAAAASTVVLERTLATVTLALLGLVGAIFSYEPLASAVWLLGLLLLAGIALAFILLKGWVPRFVSNGKGRWCIAWINFASSAGELRTHKKAVFVSGVLSALFQINVVLVVIAIMAGLGLEIPSLSDMVYITSATSVMAMIPLGLNGYGLREGAYVLLLQPLGFAPSDAITISILFAVFVTIYSVWGGVNWLFVRNSNQVNKPEYAREIQNSHSVATQSRN